LVNQDLVVQSVPSANLDLEVQPVLSANLGSVVPLVLSVLQEGLSVQEPSEDLLEERSQEQGQFQVTAAHLAPTSLTTASRETITTAAPASTTIRTVTDT
jgi:hypothetical protein